MRHLVESISSKTAGKYSLKPYKDSVLDWLDENGFRRMPNWSRNRASDIYKQNDRCYQEGPNDIDDERTNWVSVHGGEVLILTMWFDRDDQFADSEVILRYGAPNKLGFRNACGVLKQILEEK